MLWTSNFVYAREVKPAGLSCLHTRVSNLPRELGNSHVQEQGEDSCEGIASSPRCPGRGN